MKNRSVITRLEEIINGKCDSAFGEYTVLYRGSNVDYRNLNMIKFHSIAH